MTPVSGYFIFSCHETIVWSLGVGREGSFSFTRAHYRYLVFTSFRCINDTKRRQTRKLSFLTKSDLSVPEHNKIRKNMKQ